MTYPELAKRFEALATQIQSVNQDALASNTVSTAADALVKALVKFEKALAASLKSTSGEIVQLRQVLADPYFATLSFAELKVLSKDLLPKSLSAKKGEAAQESLDRLASLVVEAGTSDRALELFRAAADQSAAPTGPDNIENQFLEIGRLKSGLRDLALSQLSLPKLKQFAEVAGIKVSAKTKRPALEKRLAEVSGRIAMQVDWDPVGSKSKS